MIAKPEINTHYAHQVAKFSKIGGAIGTHKRWLVTKPAIIDNNRSGSQPIGLTDNRRFRHLELTNHQSGTSVAAVGQVSLDPLCVGRPPLAEQCRIVAKVDELMALEDALGNQLATARLYASAFKSSLRYS